MKQLPAQQRLLRIAIDGRALSHPQRGGFKTYTVYLLKSLLDQNLPYHFTIYLDRPLKDDFLLDEKGVTVKISSSSTPLIGVPLRENLSLPYTLSTDRINLAHFPCATAPLWTPCPFVVTIHDTIEHLHIPTNGAIPPLKRDWMHLYNRYNQVIAAHHSAAIITVSQNSKKDITRTFNIPEEKIHVIYEAPQQGFTPIEDRGYLMQWRHEHGLDQDFILGIGSADARKNLNGLIRAYSRLPVNLLECYQLVIILTHELPYANGSALAEKLGLSQRIRFLHGVTDEDLVLLYNAASIFVYPTLYEGFGLPPLEAMACKTPVVAANNSSIPEIVGDAALLVDDVDPNKGDCTELAAKIARVLEDDAFRKGLIQRGIERLKRFSWSRCAEETAKVYELIATPFLS